MLELSNHFSKGDYEVFLFSDKKFDDSLEGFRVVSVAAPRLLR